MFDKAKIMLVQLIASQHRLTLLLFQAQDARPPDTGKTLTGRPSNYNIDSIAIISIYDRGWVLNFCDISTNNSGRNIGGKCFTGILIMIQCCCHSKTRLNEALAHSSGSAKEVYNFGNRGISQALLPLLMLIGVLQPGRKFYTVASESWKVFTTDQVSRAVTTSSGHVTTP